MTLTYDIITTPFHRKLIGLAGPCAEGQCFGDARKALTEKLWPVMEKMGVAHQGIVHMVFDTLRDVFVGVEPIHEGMEAPEGVEYRTINYVRRAEYVHVGKSRELPEIWNALLTELELRKETRLGPDMEIYSELSDDPGQRRTTIMIGLLGDE